MAELLIRVTDKTNLQDVYKDVQLTKRGHVITVVPDGWSWSEVERTNPDWRIFKWPSVSVDDCIDFLMPEPDLRPVKVGVDPMLQRRAYKLDVDLVSLPTALKNYLADTTRVSPWFTIPANITLAQVKKQVAKRLDPNVIG